MYKKESEIGSVLKKFTVQKEEIIVIKRGSNIVFLAKCCRKTDTK